MSMYFHYFVIISHSLKKKTNSLHQRMHCAKFSRNCPSGSGKEDENVKSLRTDGQHAIRKVHLSFHVFYVVNVFSLFR